MGAEKAPYSGKRSPLTIKRKAVLHRRPVFKTGYLGGEMAGVGVLSVGLGGGVAIYRNKFSFHVIPEEGWKRLPISSKKKRTPMRNQAADRCKVLLRGSTFVWDSTAKEGPPGIFVLG